MTADVSAKLECQELIHRATFHLDKQQWPDYAACFAPDGVLIRPSDGARLEGPAAIIESHSIMNRGSASRRSAKSSAMA